MSDQEDKKADEEKKVNETTNNKKIIVDNLSPRQIIEIDACTRCGECVEWCPVYNQDEREGVTPRSKATRFKKILSSQYGLFRADSFLGKLFRKRKVTPEELKQFAADLYECSTCRQCHFVCPSQIDTVELWEGIRRSFVDAGYGPLEQQKHLIQSVKSYDNPWGQPRSSRTRWAKIAKRQKKIVQEPRDITRHKAEVLYFVGCTGSYDVNVEQVAINTIKILDELGFKTMITSCAGCFKTIKRDYPKMGKLNFEVKHTVEFLIDLIQSGKLKLKNEVNMKVTYHDPCHMGRHNNLYDAPRKLLELIPGIELIEMERTRENARCCGAGGGLKAGYPDIQNKISQTRIKEAEATGATELVSACPFCYQGLQVGIQALDSTLTMRDITELVCMAIEDKSQV